MNLEEKFAETIKRLKGKKEEFTQESYLGMVAGNREFHPQLEKLKKDIICSIESKVSNEKHQQYYIDYVLGYLTTKPNAYIEDIEAAIDTAKFFRENKHLYEEKGYDKLNEATPTQLGLSHDQLQATMLEIKQTSKNQWIKMKTDGTLPKGTKIDVAYEDKIYKVFKVAKLQPNPTEEEKELQHLKYCVIGKDTKWCTANPVGTYYSYYIHDDIYAVWKEGKPLYQFSIKNNSVGQFMDTDDRSVDTLKAELIEILESLFKE